MSGAVGVKDTSRDDHEIEIGRVKERCPRWIGLRDTVGPFFYICFPGSNPVWDKASLAYEGEWKYDWKPTGQARTDEGDGNDLTFKACIKHGKL